MYTYEVHVWTKAGAEDYPYEVEKYTNISRAIRAFHEYLLEEGTRVMLMRQPAGSKEFMQITT